jgi:hypothetical protein
MPKTRRFLAVMTIAAAALVGGAAASAAPMSALRGLPQAVGSASVVVPADTVCWWSHGCKYCRWCWWAYGVKICKDPYLKYCKNRKHKYYY